MDYQVFLSEIIAIEAEYEKEYQTRMKSGNAFNLFSVLGEEKRELAHSSFLAELLNPVGSHGKGDSFLKLFLQMVLRDFYFDTKTTKVIVEYVIGPISKDWKYGGRIDILITDSKNNAIVIENKIQANDQKKQLLRYENFCKESNYSYKIIYLTPDGRCASMDSTGKSDLDYLCLSYQADILPWLEKCLVECIEGTRLRTSIEQYIETLRKSFKMMDETHTQQLIDLVVKPENTKAFLSLLANRNVIAKAIIDRFVCRLKSAAEELGMEVEIDDNFGSDKKTYMSFSMSGASKNWFLWLGSDHKEASWVYYGIATVDSAKSTILKRDLDEIPHLWGEKKAQSKDYPCGYEYLYSETGVKNSGKWYDWYSAQALEAMEDGSMQQFLVEHVLKPVIESKVLFKLKRYKKNV